MVKLELDRGQTFRVQWLFLNNADQPFSVAGCSFKVQVSKRKRNSRSADREVVFSYNSNDDPNYWDIDTEAGSVIFSLRKAKTLLVPEGTYLFGFEVSTPTGDSYELEEMALHAKRGGVL